MSYQAVFPACSTKKRASLLGFRSRGDLGGSRTRVDGMKTRCTNRYTTRPAIPRVYIIANILDISRGKKAPRDVVLLRLYCAIQRTALARWFEFCEEAPVYIVGT